MTQPLSVSTLRRAPEKAVYANLGQLSSIASLPAKLPRWHRLRICPQSALSAARLILGRDLALAIIAELIFLMCDNVQTGRIGRATIFTLCVVMLLRNSSLDRASG